MNITFTGKIIAALPVQQGQKQDGTTWTKADYVIEELNQQYPSRCCFQVFGSDKLQQMNIRPGEVLTVHLGVKANQSKQDGNRWFNQLDCFRVERFGEQMPQQQGSPVYYPNQQMPPQQMAQAYQPQGQAAPPQQAAPQYQPQGQMQGQGPQQQGQQGNLPF